LRRKVAAESASHYTVASVVSANFAPVDAKAIVRSLGDEGNLFAQVEFGRGFVIASLDFDQ
jgi:hypothetical protein